MPAFTSAALLLPSASCGTVSVRMMPSGPSFPFISFDNVALCNWLSLACHGRETRPGRSREDLHQIHEVAAENPQVFRPAARVLLSAGPHFEDRPELSVFDHPLYHRNDWAIPRLIGDGQLGVRHFAGAHDLVGLANDAFARKRILPPGLALIEPLNDDRREHPDNPAQKIRHPRDVRILPRSRDFH